jgi:hypothetical protein
MYTIKVYIVLCSVFLRAKLNLTVLEYLLFHVVCIPIKPGDCNIWNSPWIKFPLHQPRIDSLLFTEEGWVTTIQYIIILQANIIQHRTVSSPIVCILSVVEWQLRVRLHFVVYGTVVSICTTFCSIYKFCTSLEYNTYVWCLFDGASLIQ